MRRVGLGAIPGCASRPWALLYNAFGVKVRGDEGRAQGRRAPEAKIHDRGAEILTP
jgi:hypothetical protein